MTTLPDLTPEQLAEARARTPKVVRTHLSLFVSDPEALAAWYVDVLGMKISARGPAWVFLSFGRKHHDIALIQAPEGAEHGQLGLQHYGIEVDGTLQDLARLHAMLLAHGVEIVKVTDHKVGIGVYFTDPDGNRLEFFCETVTDDAEGRAIFEEHGAPSEPTVLDPLFT